MAAVTPEIVGRNFEVTPDIRQLVESKLGRVEDRLFDDVISVRVMLEVEKYRNICEILIVGKEHDVKAVQESQTSQGSAVGRATLPIGLRQLSAMARMRAMVVLPMPLCPLKM